MPNSTCSPCRSGALILQGASRRWADDRDSICRNSIHRCHIAGIGCLCAATAETACRATAGEPPATAAAPAGATQPTLLGQYGDWGAYIASPGGNRVCFALAKPKMTKTKPAGRKRDPSYVFVATRPAENVKNEVSVIIGYSFKTSSDATAEVGTEKFAMYTQNDGAWIRNVAEEPRMVDAMRKGADLTVKGTSGRGTTSTDQYSLQGLAQALNKIEQECK
jgi:invasion protein IalB